jgi:uncharacterized protein (DUF2252 family)
MSATALPPVKLTSAEAGRAARAEVPRSAHARWEPAADRPDPIALLEREARTRIPELVPIRHQRMLASPFAFFRGSAAIMAADLATTPVGGVRVQLCGDAHFANFGGFAAPDRHLVFDLNDFDETLPGPWEWDVKRLATSLALAGRVRGFDRRERRDATVAAVREYRLTMRRFAAMRTLDVWYARLDIEPLAARWAVQMSKARRKALDRALQKGRAKDSRRAYAKLTEEIDGEPRIVSDPPLIVPIEELMPLDEADELDARLRELLRGYGETLQSDRRHLLHAYRPVHVARKVVGIGSVGKRAWIVLMLGDGRTDPLFLQVKEAVPSVLEPFAGASLYATSGQRVVEGQRLMQAASDVFLGWFSVEQDLDGEPRAYYVRQLWDAKLSVSPDTVEPRELAAYAEICGWTLARAHARSGDRAAIAAYLGGGDRFDRAIAEFAEGYADQTERDHAALAAAVEAGVLAAA